MGEHHQVTASLHDHSLWSIPERILQRRSVTRGVQYVQQLLIKWSNIPDSLTTWEDAEALRQQFPQALVWGQTAHQGGGDVSIVNQQEPGLSSASDGHRKFASRLGVQEELTSVRPRVGVACARCAALLK